MIRRPPISTRTDTLFPYTTLFRSANYVVLRAEKVRERRRTKDSIPDAARYCAQRLRLATPSFTVLLGDFGSGKTTLAEQIHAQLAAVFLAEESDVFPLRSEERRVGKECVQYV